MKKEKRNETTRFILPMLAEEISYKKNDVFEPMNSIFFTRDSFVNVYLADENHPEYVNKILVKYKYDYLLDFPIFERKMEHMIDYLTDYPVDDGIVYVFDIPDRWIDVYNSFKNGKYSEFPEDYKQHVLAFWDQDTNSPMSNLFQNKTEQMKKYLKEKKNITLEELNNPGELWFMPDDRDIIKTI